MPYAGPEENPNGPAEMRHGYAPNQTACSLAEVAWQQCINRSDFKVRHSKS